MSGLGPKTEVNELKDLGDMSHRRFPGVGTISPCSCSVYAIDVKISAYTVDCCMSIALHIQVSTQTVSKTDAKSNPKQVAAMLKVESTLPRGAVAAGALSLRSFIDQLH